MYNLRPKTELRAIIETYLLNGADGDWLCLPYSTKAELNKIRSMYHKIKTETSIIDYDRANKIVWILDRA